MDYYEILGLTRGATDREIKKAYKKLSIKWHPDRNKENEDEAKEMFMEISNAYEALIDPQKRQAYNRGGKKAVEEVEQEKGNAHVKRDIFGRIIHTEDHEPQAQDLFGGTDVLQLNLETIHSFYRRNQVWVVLFYKSNQQESVNVKNEYM